jgi:nucleotide-binding universal stress UspA family protein
MPQGAASRAVHDPDQAFNEGNAMALGTLLLHLDGGPHRDAHIDLAIHLAHRHASHLVGVSASGRTPFSDSVGAQLLQREQLAAALAAAHALAEGRAQHFDERVRAAATPCSHEAIVDDDDDAPALVRHGLCCDLAMLCLPDPAALDGARARAQLELALLHGAPPALVLPHAPASPAIGRRILVAWNGSRESARAVAAALPLLQRAEVVQVVQCETPLDQPGGDRAPGADRVRDWLARDGVRADARLLSTGEDAGRALLLHARDAGADLLVMGAWGRMRWSERLFGGVTRTLLARTTVPLLLAR